MHPGASTKSTACPQQSGMGIPHRQKCWIEFHSTRPDGGAARQAPHVLHAQLPLDTEQETPVRQMGKSRGVDRIRQETAHDLSLPRCLMQHANGIQIEPGGLSVGEWVVNDAVFAITGGAVADHIYEADVRNGVQANFREIVGFAIRLAVFAAKTLHLRGVHQAKRADRTGRERVIGEADEIHAVAGDLHPGVFDVAVEKAVFKDREVRAGAVFDEAGESQRDGAARPETGDVGGVLRGRTECLGRILPLRQAIGPGLIGRHAAGPGQNTGIRPVDGGGTGLTGGGRVGAGQRGKRGQEKAQRRWEKRFHRKIKSDPWHFKTGAQASRLSVRRFSWLRDPRRLVESTGSAQPEWPCS